MRWLGALAAVALASCTCPGEMRGCRKQWNALVHATSQSEEASLAQRFAECGDRRDLRYGLTLKNRRTGAKVSFVDYARLIDPIAVTLSVGRELEEDFVWVPLSNANIVELMAE